MIRCLPASLLLVSAAAAQDIELPIASVPAEPHASGANLASNSEGVLLSWIEPAGDGGDGHTLRFSRLQGDRWGSPRTIAAGSKWFVNWADVPTVAEQGDMLLAAWLVRSGKSYAYDVHLARSANDGESWEQLGELHRDRTPTEHGFVAMVPATDGFDVFWLDGREMVDGGTGNMTLRTARVGAEVGAGTVLDPDVCTCCQVSATRTSRGPIVVYRDHARGEIRDISIVRRTVDGWSAPHAVAEDGWLMPGCPVNGPHADALGDDLAVAWFTAAGGTPKVKVSLSGDGGATFAPPVVVDEDRPLGRVAVVSLEGGAVVCWLGGDGDRATLRLRGIGRDGWTGPSLRVATTSAERASGFPRMVRDGDRLVLVWRPVGDEPGLRSACVPIAAVTRPAANKRDC